MLCLRFFLRQPFFPFLVSIFPPCVVCTNHSLALRPAFTLFPDATLKRPAFENNDYVNDTFVLSRKMIFSYEKYFVSLVNNDPSASLQAYVVVRYSIPGCLEFLLLLLIPVGILGAVVYVTYKFTSQRKVQRRSFEAPDDISGSLANENERGIDETSKGHSSQQLPTSSSFPSTSLSSSYLSSSSSSLDVTAPAPDCCTCCIWDLSSDSGPPNVPDCCPLTKHKLPLWNCCCSFPVWYWERPAVSWSAYWRQNILFTAPWNPYEGEVLDFTHRLAYMCLTLVFNLLVLTIWSHSVLTLNQNFIDPLTRVRKRD